MFGQIREAFKVTKQEKPWIGAALVFIVIAVVGVGILAGSAAGHPIYAAFVSFPFAGIAAMLFFSFVANRAAYASIEGVAGAGASPHQSAGSCVWSAPRDRRGPRQDCAPLRPDIIASPPSR